MQEEVSETKNVKSLKNDKAKLNVQKADKRSD